MTGNTFLGKFGPKNKNCQFELKFRTRLIWICRIIQKICGAYFFYFRQEKSFLDKSGQKNQNCQLKQKFGTKRRIWICGIQWWCQLFQFLTENNFLCKLDSKIQNCFFKVKFDTKTNSIMQNSMAVSFSSVLDWK